MIPSASATGERAARRRAAESRCASGEEERVGAADTASKMRPGVVLESSDPAVREPTSTGREPAQV